MLTLYIKGYFIEGGGVGKGGGQAANMRFEFLLYFMSVLKLYLCGQIYLWLPGLFINNGLVSYRSPYKTISLYQMTSSSGCYQ
jgi:hypothetical protein